MCLNKPIQIPVGSNGKSVFIAYAQSSTGTGFSYTPADSRTYISFVVKKGTVTQTDFTTWTKYIGTDGTDGTNGTGVSNVYVSDGSTAIGGITYAINTVVVLMSNGSYINAGIINPVPLVWTDITMLNDWASGTSTDTAQYSIYNGYLYLRGTIDAAIASSGTFCTLPVSNTNGIRTSISSTADPNICRTLTVAAISHNLVVTTYGTSIYMLDSVPPISIR